jgi:hypothetical protein
MSDAAKRCSRPMRKNRHAMKELLHRHPLLRLLAVNLAGGIVVAVIAVGGLLALDIQGLRHLIFADQSPAVALFVILFSFIVTFGSWVMGTAIMRLGKDEGRHG